MAIVQAGKQFTADDLKRTAGDLAAMLADHAQAGLDLKKQLESWPDADLVALGLKQEEINAIKGFFIADVPPIADLIAASTWIKQLIGLGV